MRHSPFFFFYSLDDPVNDLFKVDLAAAHNLRHFHPSSFRKEISELALRLPATGRALPWGAISDFFLRELLLWAVKE